MPSPSEHHDDDGSAGAAVPPPRWSAASRVGLEVSGTGGACMAESLITADYLIVGAGAVGMAFADSVLAADTNASMVIVDRHDRPGGHWNDAYPFVRLHQPSSTYGVNSVEL